MEYFEKGTKSELIYWANRAYEKGMVPATSGNISSKTQGGIYISGSGVCLADMDEEDIVKIDSDANIIESEKTPGKKPSSEKFMHTQIYSLRDDIKSIIHIHCPYITAFAVCDKEMDEPILPEFIYNFDKLPMADYYMPSSVKLAQETAKLFSTSNAVLMQNHGLVVGATSTKEAFYDAESIQAYAKTFLFAKVLGKPCRLNKDEIKEIKSMRMV